MPSPATADGEVVTFDREGFASLVRYSVIAGGNYEVGKHNTAALESQSQAYNKLVQCSRLAHQFAEVREEQLERERRDHFIDNWFHRGLIALGILVSL